MPDVEIGGRYGGLYRWLDWPGRLAAVNLLWLLGVLAGLIIGGIAPSTVAAAVVLRSRLTGTPLPLWSGFWRCWRAELGRSQLRLGVPILTVWVVAFYVVAAGRSPLGLALLVVGSGYLTTLLYLPAVLAHVDLPARRAWLLTVHVAWKRPLVTIGLALGTGIALVASVLWLPAAVPFAFPSAPLALATWLCLDQLGRPEPDAAAPL